MKNGKLVAKNLVNFIAAPSIFQMRKPRQINFIISIRHLHLISLFMVALGNKGFKEVCRLRFVKKIELNKPWKVNR